ncbi:MAG: hypothetical protein Q9216_002811 [Gyalolechia sp. 2 TL-2023]
MGYGRLANQESRSAPVDPSSFFKSLFRIWRPPVSNTALPGPLKLALAVSGGADSMALATLCSQIRQFDNHCPELRDVRFHAFVVDHQARPGSTKEARQVVKHLDKKLGLNKRSKLKTKILRLQWPPGVNPAELPNFETEARRLRYQALGKACYKANIPSLLLGHHEADEKETLIMRLVEGYRGEGLRGILEEADIPECQGIYGVGQSGGRDYTVTWEEKQMIKARDGKGMQEVLPPTQEYRQPGFEHGGVRIFRPLMDFDKPALEATLIKAGVPWVTDTTNSDPTLSIRNTIRYLLQRRLLPHALDSGPQNNSSRLKRAANTIRRRFQQRNERAGELFQACDIISFNARSGNLKVRIPLSAAPPSDPDFYTQSVSRQEIEVEHISARLVRLLLSIVAPCDHLSLQSLEFATKAMFWRIQHSHAPGRGTGEAKPQPKAFTAAGVLCQRVESPMEEAPRSPAQPSVLDPAHVWCLSRSPYIKTQPEPACIFPPVRLPEQKEAEERDEKEDKAEETKKAKKRNAGKVPEKGKIDSPQPTWQLWDGRFWIQVIHPPGKPVLRIYPLSQDRLARLTAHLKRNGRVKHLRQLKRWFNALGPPHVRHTIPAIVDDEDNCLALPTLSFRVPYPRGSGKSTRDEARALRWRVRYKRVVFPDRVREENITAPKDKKLEGVGPTLVRVAEEEERDKSREQKKLEKEEKKRKADEAKEEAGGGGGHGEGAEEGKVMTV